MSAAVRRAAAGFRTVIRPINFTTGGTTMASKKEARSKKTEGKKKVEIEDLPKANQDQKDVTPEQAREVKGGMKYELAKTKGG
jgi:hypothetical protein